jgi:tetratricopeptide (TPR) repeat protein/transcriptional regulator with XRE-family HTH domain
MAVNSNEWLAFGELLKMFRTRKHITQLQLAEALSVHRHSIGRWEQGDGLPAHKALVLELARYLHLDDVEMRQLLEASFTAPVPPVVIPYPRNPLFTGREELLESIHQRLSAGHVAGLNQSFALVGLAGMGKTYLALEYAYRYGLEYSAVLWIDAEQTETILASFTTIANVLHLPQRQDPEQQQVATAVGRWLAVHSEWLLIWDNLEDMQPLRQYVPATHQGSILITTRRQTLGAVAQGSELRPLQAEEGVLFLLRRARLLNEAPSTLEQLAQSAPGELAAARELVTKMDGLPLALDQAGAYVEETPCRLTDYLELFQTKQAALLRRRGETSSDHPASVVATWSLAFEKVEQASRAAADLLRMCAFLHPDAIAEEIFLARTTAQDEMREPIVSDMFAWHEAIRAVSAYSLLKRNVQEQTLSMHRLVQAVLREEMSREEQKQWQERVILRLKALFPEAKPEAWPQCARLLPHVLACMRAIPEQAGSMELADVLRKSADYLSARAQYREAEPLYQRALHIQEQQSELESLLAASTLFGLAKLYRAQGRYELADAPGQRALHIREQTLGADHLDVASSLNELATLAYEQGKYDQAETLYQRAWRIRKKTWGARHQEVARSLHNLAMLYCMQGKYDQAESLAQQALDIWEQTREPEHLDVAYVLTNLAEISLAQGKYAQAKPLYWRALGIWEHHLGAGHPYIAYPLDGLADIFCEQEDYQQAEQLYERALHVREQALGDEHPKAALSLQKLANLRQKQERIEEAESLYQRSLAILEQGYGQHHPETAKTLASLARFYAARGNHEQARALLQRAYPLLEELLGREHPETLKAGSDFGNLPVANRVAR